MLNALKNKKTLSKDDIAEILKVSPEALEEFEKSYAKHVLEPNVVPDNLLDMNVHKFKDKNGNLITEESPEVNELIDRIVNELLEDTEFIFMMEQNISSFSQISLLIRE